MDIRTSGRLSKIPLFSRLMVQVILGVTLISFISVIGINLFFLSFIDTTLRKNVGENAVLVVQQAVVEVKERLLDRVEYFQAYVANPVLTDALMLSNENIELLEGGQMYIEERNKEWISAPEGTTTLFMREIIGNQLSESLRNATSYFTLEYGYPVYTEVFVTNKYGANVAQTGRTSDYYQADKEWWQVAARDGVYIGEIDFDENAGINSMNIGIAVKDEDGNFIGVLKAVLDIKEITNAIRQLTPSEGNMSSEEHIAHGHTSHRTINFTLIRNDDSVIFSTTASNVNDLIQNDVHIQLFTSRVDGYFFTKKGEKEVLIAHAHSFDAERSGLNFSLLLEHEITEMLAPAGEFVNRFITIMTLSILLIFTVTVFLIVRFVVRPIIALTSAANKIARGDLSAHVRIGWKGEIGQLGLAFNTMTSRLNDSQEHLEEKVRSRTKELQNTQRALEKQLAELEKFQKLTVGRELRMIELKKEIKKLSGIKDNGGTEQKSS